MTGGHDLPVGGPIDVADGLGEFFELLDELPGVNIFEGVDAVEMYDVVLLCGQGAVLRIGGEGERGDAVCLPDRGVAYFHAVISYWINEKTIKSDVKIEIFQ